MNGIGQKSVSKQRPRTRPILLALWIGIVGVGLLDQGLQHLALKDGELRGVRVAPYDPPRFNQSQDQEWLRLRDQISDPKASPSWLPFSAELGWEPSPNSSFGDYAYDGRGARIGNPEAERPSAAAALHVAAYGCSFTHGDEVKGPASWPAQLERLAPRPVRVVNFGVGAYGLDQALLRLRKTLPELASAAPVDEVWFGLMPDAGLRATTCYRPLIRPWSSALAFKPRFEPTQAGKLELILNPAQRLEEVLYLANDAAAFERALLPIDPWVAGFPAAYSPRGSSWLHQSGLLRLYLTYAVRRAPDCSRELSDPASLTHRVLLAILVEAAREANAHGARFRCLILPCKEDLMWSAKHSQAYWQGWAETCQAEGLQILDCSAALGGPLALNFATAGGHYGELGNRRIAEWLAARL